MLNLIRKSADSGVFLSLTKDGGLKFELSVDEFPESLKAEIIKNKSDLIKFLSGGVSPINHFTDDKIIKVTSNNDPLLLSFSQQRLWLLDKIDGGSAHYNMPYSLKLMGDLNTQALTQALTTIIERHESLRTHFVEGDDGQPVQIIQPMSALALPVTDLSSLAPGVQAFELAEQVSLEAERLFDLSRNIMLRSGLIKLSKTEHVLLVTMHHIASDGWSMNILINEFSALYTAYTQGLDNPLTPLDIQYADYAHWQRNWLQGEVLDEQLGYWTTQLANLPVVHSLPLDKIRPASQTFAGATHLSQLSAETSRQLNKVCQLSGATLFMGLHAAFTVLLSRYSNETDIVVGSPIANREQAEVANLIGFFVNTLVLRSDLSDNPSFIRLLAQSKKMLLDAYAHQQVPFEALVEKLQPARSLSHSPLFQVMLVLQNNESGTLALPGLELSPVEAELNIAKYDLTLNITESEDGLLLGWEYNTDLFQAESIERMAGSFTILLDSLVNSPTESVFNLEMLSEAERHQQLVQWNDTAADYPTDMCIHELFEKQVEKTPDAIAVVFENEALSYSELNAKANQLAHYLIDKGVKPDTLVGLCVERSFDMVIGLMGILKAGGAYVPLDPNYPQERLYFMLEDSQVSVLLTQSHLQENIPISSIKVVCLDEEVAFIDQVNINPARCSGSEDLAYVIYTSGSTGKPKGVMIQHNNFVNLAHYQKDLLEVENTSRVLQFASISFDAACWEWSMALVHGAALYFDQDERLKQPSSLLNLLEEQSITHATLPPSLLAVIPEHALPALITLIVAGEACPPQLVKFWSQNRRFINAYGPTESTVCATMGLCTNEMLSLPIGRPVNNTQIYILDAHQQPQPVGIPGELCIAGAGLARGYLNRPELTAEKFIANPFSDESDAKLYKTGDLCRYLPDGNIEFIGRIDNQVKIRGFRIELGEIESALSAFDDVNDAVVVARESSSGDKSLVAYVVTDNAGECKTEDEDEDEDENSIHLRHEFIDRLRQGLNQSLPDYMVPSAFVVLDKLPLTPNGKIDRKALPAPGMSLQQAVYVAPVTEVEKVLCEIWQELLALEQVGITDNFFELGGHSLLATRLIASINQKFEVTLPLKLLFSAPSVSGLCSELLLLQKTPLEKRQGRPALTLVSREEVLPSSYAQQRLWLLDKIAGGSAHYNMPGSLKLTGDLNRQALTQALTTIIERHESLRTHFVEGDDGQPIQVIQAASALALDIPLTDLSSLAPGVRAFELAEQVSLEAGRVFDLSRDVMLRAGLIKLSKTEHVLLVNMHHIACDGWSMRILINEFSTLYTAYAQGLDNPLPELDIQYADYAHWQRNWLQGEVLDEQLGYWTTQLADLPVVHSLPLDKIRPASQTFAGATHLSQLSAETSRQLNKVCQLSGATLFMGLHAAFTVLLSRYSNETDIVVGSPIANREQAEVANLIGFFVNTLVLRSDLSDNPSFTGLLAQSKKMLLDAYAHQQVPFEALVEKLQPARSLRHSPLFQVMLVLQNNENGTLSLPGLELSQVEGAEEGINVAKYDLTLNVTESEDGLLLGWEYNTDLFEPQSIERMAGNFTILLDGLLENPTESIFNVEMLSEAERHQQLVKWNDTATDYRKDKCIHELFEARVEQAPDAIAVVFEEAVLSYSELNAKANQLARYLIEERHVTPDTLVGICVERSLDMVVGIMAILKAGGAYVPLDPDYPESRLKYMLEDAQLDTVLTQIQLADKVPLTIEQAVYLNDEFILDRLAQCSIYNVNPNELGLTAHHLAYVIYTSGSTGKPKGVEVDHKGVVAFLSSPNYVNASYANRVASFSSFSFDGFVYDLFFSLSSGVELYLYKKELILHIDGLKILLIKDQITNFFTTTALFNRLVVCGVFEGTQIKQVLFGGEKCDESSIKTFKINYPNISLMHVYGPTESIVFASVCSLNDDSEVFPIGKPVNNNCLLVLDCFDQVVPIGAAGELFVGGDSLAKGYLNRPELTAERFIDNPFYDKNNRASSKRLYKTGDLCRYLPDGNIEFIGRIDSQVKIRGFRIELGEIESSLSAFDDVSDAVVVAIENSSGAAGDKSLVAYVVTDNAGECKAEDEDESSIDLRHAFIEGLREGIKQSLPDYMVPSAFVVLDKLPLTPNGKVDRKALPAPDMSLQQAAYVAPTSETEKVLCDIWQQVLGLEQVGLTDNFFALGGHSLLVMKVIAKAQAAGLSISAKSLFASPTLAELAQHLDATQADATPVFKAPDNLIPVGCEHITPEMLPLVSLTQANIEQLASKVPGGASNIQDIYPLGPLQAGILYTHMMSEESDPYVLPSLFRLDSEAAISAFIEGLQFIINRHDVLRTAVFWRDLPIPVQVVCREVTLPVSWLELDKNQCIQTQMEALTAPEKQWMELSQAPLLQVKIAKDNESEQHFVLLQFHHLISDHVGLEIIQKELAAYNNGEAAHLPQTVPYRGFIAHAQHQAEHHDAEKFFTEQLGDIDEPTTPFNLVDVQGNGTRIIELKEMVAPTVSCELRSLCKLLKVSPASLFHSAWAMVIGACSGRDDVVFGTVMSGRLQGTAGSEHMLGVFINTLPVRINLTNTSTRDFVLTTQQVLHSLIPYEQTPLALAQGCSALANNTPLFSAMLNYRHSAPELTEDSAEASIEVNKASVIEYLQGQERTNYPFTLSVDDFGVDFQLDLKVDLSVDVERVMSYMQTALAQLAKSLTSTPEQLVHQLSVLPESERHQQLVQWNDTAADYPADKCIHELFEAQVEQTPDAIAVVFEDETLTYSELNAKANQLAHYLIEEKELTPDTLVGICVERSLDMIVGIMAILKAGGAYVPLDPDYPQERLEYMIEDARLDTVLTQRQLADKVPVTIEQAVYLNDGSVLDRLAQYSTRNITPSDLGLSSRHLAYVIYTSGSTGKPKGVMIEHSNTCALSQWAKNTYQPEELELVLASTSICFDLSVYEIIVTLQLGGSVLVVDNILELPDTGCRERLTLINTVPSAIRELHDAGNIPQSVKVINLAGEPLKQDLVCSLYESGVDKVFDLYGPSEDTTYSTFKLRQVQELASIGQPICNTTAYIVDKFLNPVPVGFVGELCVGGAGLARGYLNQPALTAEKFIANPFSDEPDTKLYKTGDLCRYLPDGNIEFIGRIDNQVKIRGFRIELGEIESSLSAFDEVNDAVVVAREISSGDAGDKSLVAYVVTDKADEYTGEDESSTHLRHEFIEGLRQDLNQSLPDYMVPSAFVVLDKLPLTANGKIDRKALPAPDISLQQAAYVAPTSDTEKVLCEIWQAVLGLEQVGITDNFFALGGHSLLVMTVIAKVQAAGLLMTAKSLFSSPTLAELAQHLDATQADATPVFKAPENLISVGCEHITPEMLPLVSLTQANIEQLASKVPGGARNIQDIYPLGPLQTGVLYTHMMSEESDPYVLPSLFRLDSEAAISAFIEGLQFIINRHDVLRTAVFWRDLPIPVQVVCREVTLPVSWLELDKNQCIQTQMEALTAPEKQWMELSQAPLLQVKIAKDNESEQHFVLLQFHHLISDHVGLEIIQKELAAYNNGEAAHLPQTVPYRGFIAHAQHQAEHHDAEKFFTEQLGDIDEPTTPFNLVDVQGNGTRIIELKEMVAPTVSCELRSLCKLLKVSPASLFHSAWAMVIGACSGRDDVVFGTVMSGRLQGTAGSEHMLGVFINTLPVRINLTNTSTRDLVLTTQQVLHSLIPYEQTPLALAQGCSALANNTPLFSAMLNYRHSAPELTEDSAEASIEVNKASVIEYLQGQERTNYPFTLSVDDFGVDFQLDLKVDLSVDVERVMSYMQTALAQLVKSLSSTSRSTSWSTSGQLAHQLSVLPESERHQQLVQWNDTAADYPTDKCIHQLFEQQVEQTPDAIAVVFEDEVLSYSELNAKANQLAHYLIDKGVKPETLVGLCVERSFDMVIGLMGVLKAGGAYVPLDPDYPQARLQYMFEDSQVPILLTQSSLLKGLPVNNSKTITLDGDWQEFAQFETTNPTVNIQSDNLVYVIYTSGSTGRPKGTLVDHQALTNHINWIDGLFGCDTSDVILQKTPFSFDVSVWEFFWPVVSGAQLVLAKPGGHKDPEYLAGLIQRKNVTKLHFVPSMLSQMLSSDAMASCDSLKQVFCGGEALPSTYIQSFYACCESAELYNLYGPTEATIDVSAWHCQLTDYLDSSIVPIGRPIDNIQLYILSHNARPVPQGVAGELYIGGAGLARGYLNQPALTAEKFIPNPFYDASDPNSSKRLYKTGDLCRYLPDGNIEFIGRIDNQVKIRGFRIELGEIESSLSAFDDVNDAVVVARENSSGDAGDKLLVAYVVTDKAVTDNAGECKAEDEGEDEHSNHLRHEFIEKLRQGIKQSLPDYMVPSVFVVLDKLPLTPNGKIDRKALPAPDMSLQQAAYEAPGTATEKVLCEIWQEVLGLEQVGLTDNFFELGGHSLLVMTVIAKVQAAGLLMTAKSIFALPTLAELAQHLDVTQAEAAPEFKAPDNLISVGCEHITPEMLPLVSLTQANITQLASKVPGGAGNIQDIYPLGPLQAGILYTHMMSEESDPYVLPSLFRLDSEAAISAFIEGLQFIINRHDVLRTAVFWRDLPAPVQVVCREATLPVSWLELDKNQSVQTHMEALTAPEKQWMELSQAPLLQVKIARDNERGQYLVLLQFHHLISDHVGLEIIEKELAAYNKGEAAQLPQTVPYREFIAHTQHQAEHHDAETFFTEQLGDIDEPTTPFNLVDVQGNGTRIIELKEMVPPTVSCELRSLSKSLKVSPASLFHSAWAMVIGACSGRDDVVFGTVMSGRLQGTAGSEHMLGVFINTLPVRINLTNTSTRDLVLTTQQTLYDLIPYEQTPLALAQGCSALANNTPLFSAMLNYRHSAPELTEESIEGSAEASVEASIEVNKASVIEYLQGQERTNYPFTLSVDDFGVDFQLDLQVDLSADVERVMSYMQTALAQLVKSLTSTSRSTSGSAPEQLVHQLSVLPESERHQQLVQWNDTAVDYPTDQCIHQLFEKQVEQTPDAIAVVFEDEQLSYSELNAKANQLAHYLIDERYVTPDTLVGICVERSLDMVVGIMGILKAGGAYVPLDPDYPQARLEYMLEDARLDTVLTQCQLADKVPVTTEQAVYLNDGSVLDRLAQHSICNINSNELGLAAHYLAYVIYTSGSTGYPKAVMIEHSELGNFISSMATTFAIAAQDSLLAVTSLSFDIHTLELYLPLVSGSRLIVASKSDAASPDELYGLMDKHNISIMQATPSTWKMLDDSEWQTTRSIQLLCGGEALSQALNNRLIKRNHVTLWNMYGPTETCVWSLMAKMENVNSVVIGKPIGNTQCYVISEGNNLSPQGVSGELYIGGAGLARGYLNKPELTTEKFIPNPFYDAINPNSSKRLYKTGDLCRYLPDGNIEFIGRIDNQVKIRGFRIELGEIESSLSAFDDVKDAVVVARESSSGGAGDKSLVAYVVTDKVVTDNAGECKAEDEGEDEHSNHLRHEFIEKLRQGIKQSLPDYMVPSVFVVLDKLPLTPNGKIDRKALPAPDMSLQQAAYEAPGTATEKVLCEIWQEVLGVEQVGITDNFFELGGHSLTAIKLLTVFGSRFDVELPLKIFFESKNLRHLAEYLDAMIAMQSVLTTEQQERECFEL